MTETDRGSREEGGFREEQGRERAGCDLEEHGSLGGCEAGDEAGGVSKSETFARSSEVRVRENTDSDLKLEMDGQNIEDDGRESEVLGECGIGDQPDGDPKAEVFDQSPEFHVQEHGDGSRCLAGVGPGGDQPEVDGHDTKHDVRETGDCRDELGCGLKLESNDHSPKDIIRDPGCGRGCCLGGAMRPRIDAGETVGQSTLDNAGSVGFEAQDSGVHAVFTETSKALEVTQTLVTDDQSEKCILGRVEAIKGGTGSFMEIAGALVGRVLDSDNRPASTSLEIPDQTESFENGVSHIEKRTRTVDAVIGCDVTNQLVETAVNVENLAGERTVVGAGEAPARGTTSMSGSDQAMWFVPCRREVEDVDGSCGDVSMASAVVDDKNSKDLEGTTTLKITSQSGSMKEGISCFQSNPTVPYSVTGRDLVGAHGKCEEGVPGSSEIRYNDGSSGGKEMESILVERRSRDGTTESHAFASNLDFESKDMEGTTSLDAVQDDVDKICITDETNSRGASSPETVNMVNNVGSEFVSGHGQTVVDENQHMGVLEVKALRTTENAELVAPFVGQDVDVRAEVGEIGNNRSEIMVIRESSSSQSHRTKISRTDLSGHIQTLEVIMGDRKEEPDPPVESEGMNRRTDTEMVSMPDSDQLKVSESSISDSSVINKNQDVRELSNIVPRREVHESELSPSDETMTITISNDIDLSNVVVDVPKNDQEPGKSSVFDISLVKKNSDVQGVDTVLSNKEVPNVAIPMPKVPDLANLDVKTVNSESYPISENLRDGKELVPVQVYTNNAPLVEADSEDAHLGGGDNPMDTRDLAEANIGLDSNIRETQSSDLNIALTERGNPEVMHCDEDIRGSSISGKANNITNACSDFDQEEVINEVNAMKDIDKDVDDIVTIEAITEGGQGAITLEASFFTSSLCDVTKMSQAGEKKLLGDVDGFTAGYIGLSVMEDGQLAGYNLESQEKASLPVSNLVWGKVKSHPWWPGQIFDSSVASELALKYQKKDNFLVAYFGDKTFAWCDESQLKPFEEYFSQMVNQCSSDIFVKAVDDALEEVFMCVQLGMSCHCIPEKILSGIMNQKVENAGIRKGISSHAFDRSQIVSSFEPKRFLDYICASAQCFTANHDRLELLITQAQVYALYRFKVFSEQPVLFVGGALADNNAIISPSTGKGSGENAAEHSSSTLPNPNLGSNQRDGKSTLNKRKNVLKDVEQEIYELKEEETASQLVNGDKNEAGLEFTGTSYSHLSGKKQKIADFDSSVPQGLNLLRDSKVKPSLIGSFKIGECIRRAASQLTSSTSALKCTSEALRRSVTDDDRTNFYVSGFDDLPHTPLETSTTDMWASEDYSPSQMFAQLCNAAVDPLKGYSSTTGIIHFFSDFRNYCVSDSPEELHHVEKVGSKRGRIHVHDSSEEIQQVEKVGGKRGRKKKSDSQPSAVPASSETSAPDYMSDSYWSEMLFHGSLENKHSPCCMKRRGRPSTRGQMKKRKSIGELTSLVPLAPILNSPKLQAETPSSNLKAVPSERPIITSRKKYADESTPTELIFCFNKPDSLPSETDLIRIFGRYGPLKEAETEVMKKANHVKVVFKRRADAEIAFSSAGKYSIFGPTLISYRLRYLQSTPKTPPGNKMQDAKESKSQEAKDKAIMDGGTLEDPVTTMQDTKDAPPGTTSQNVKDALPETLAQEAAHVPDATPQDIEVAAAEIRPQEAKDEAIMDGGNLGDYSGTTMQDPRDAPLDITSHDVKGPLAETTAKDATHISDASPQDTEVGVSEIKLQEAKDETIMDSGILEDSGAALQDPRDAPPDTTAQDVKNSLSETAREDATDAPDATPQNTGVQVSEIELQEAKDETTMDGGIVEDLGATLQEPRDAPPDTTAQDVKDSLAETTREDATDVQDATPQNTEVQDSEIELQEAKHETTMDGGILEDLGATLQEPRDAPPDTTAQDVKDSLAETTREDATDVQDATPQNREVQDSEIELQEAKHETTMDGGNTEDPKDGTPDTTLQDTEGELAESTELDATYDSDCRQQDAKVVVSEIKPQEVRDEATVDDGNLEYSAPPVTTMQDAQDASPDTMQPDVEEAAVESTAQDATDFPDATSQDASFSLTEIKPPEAKDETTMDGSNLEDSDVKGVPLDTTQEDMIDAVAESTAQDATHSPETTT